jgi:hypothetical protein
MKTAAIFYQREGYDTTGKRLMGRQSAGEGFLKALARYGTVAASGQASGQWRISLSPWRTISRKPSD